MKRFSVIILVFLFLVASSGQVSAHHREKVLGVSTNNDLALPPTAEGPGLILPDSPLFVLDRIKQETRLFFAFNSQTKAKVYSDIAGERMAELRFMLGKDNKAGTIVALEGVAYNTNQAALQLDKAMFKGQNVSVVAKKINDAIKTKQEALDVIEDQANGEMKARIAAVQEAIFESKVIVEDGLLVADLDNEIRDDLRRRIARNLDTTATSVEEVEHDLQELNLQASDAAKRNLDNREEALKRAIEEKNSALTKTQENQLVQERKDQDKNIQVAKEQEELVKKVIEQAREVASRFEASE